MCGAGKRMHSTGYRWLSGKVKDISRLTRSVWRNCTSMSGFNKETSSIRALRKKHVEEAREWAGNLDLWAEVFAKLVSLSRPRSVSFSTHSKTSHSSLTTLWILWARSSDNVLSIWQHQPSHFCNCWSCWERRTEGTEQSPSYTPRIASPCVWFQRSSVSGMSSSLVSETLHSKVTLLSEQVHVARRCRYRVSTSFGTCGII